MHWQAAIKTSTLLSIYCGWDPSSGVLFNFGCFSRRFCRAQVLHFTFFFPPPTPSILSLLCFHTCFLLSSHHFSSLSLHLNAAFAFVKHTLCFARACSTGQGTSGGKEGRRDGRPKTVSQHMLYVPLTRPCALGGARHLCRRVD